MRSITRTSYPYQNTLVNVFCLNAGCAARTPLAQGRPSPLSAESERSFAVGHRFIALVNVAYIYDT